MLEQLDAALDAPFTLRRQPRPVPADLRPSRRIALLLLIVSQCRGTQATSGQLHVLDWAIRSAESRKQFMGFLSGFVPPDQAVVRLDPAVTRAVNYAIALGLLQDRESSEEKWSLTEDKPRAYRIALTNRGREAVTSLSDENDELLVEERAFLAAIGRKVTQGMISELLAV